MGMNIDDVLGNVKDALIKAAKEGKRKGVIEGYKKSIEIVNKYKKQVDDNLNQLINELTNLVTPEEETEK